MNASPVTSSQAKHKPDRAPKTVDRPNCPVCGRRGVRRHGPLTDRAHEIPGVYFISNCISCRIGWLDPRPIDQDIGLAYPGEYYTHDENATTLEIAVHEGSDLKSSLRRLILNERYGYNFPAPGFPGHHQVGRWLGGVAPIRYRVAYRRDEAIPRWKSPGRLLDIGCGAGDFLRYACSLGWTPLGLEPDPIAADVARRRAGAEVIVGTLDTAKLPPASFDAVVSMHSIEHAVDPRAFLREAVRLLCPGGSLYLQTPNFDSLIHHRVGGDWFALEPPRHMCILSVPAMSRLCSETGPWTTLTVRSMPRRARKEQEHALALQRAGNFHAPIERSFLDELQIGLWSMIEHVGNRPFRWGEEIEVVAIKA